MFSVALTGIFAIQHFTNDYKTGRYVIVFGHRRHKACKQARVDIVLCVIRREQMKPADVTVLQVIENLHQERMTAIGCWVTVFQLMGYADFG